jgi:predicted outer membrane repeat protein
VHNYRPARRTTPFLEALEDRTVPSGGNVGDLVVFGDSLADVGNASLATSGTYPPSALYFQGRFSGGPIWVDTLAEYLGEPLVRPSLAGGLDYAFGGALLESNPPSNFGAPSLGTQVGAYLHGHTPSSDDLFALIGGGNDFFETSVLPGGPVGPDQPAAALEDALQTLYAAGGRRFVVANLPPLGQTPAYQDLFKAGYLTQGQIDGINGWSAGYDYYLAQDLAQFGQQHADARVIPIDTAGLFQQIIASPASFGFGNVSNAIGDYTSQGGVLTDITIADHDGYLFYDSVHPGTKAHQLLGLTAAADVYEALGINEITVTNTSDAVDPLDGGLSLREALDLANAERGAVVQNTLDHGAGSLRDTIAAVSRPKIVFADSLEGQTITLTSGELFISKSVDVHGPADNPVVISGNHSSRVFDITSSSATVTLFGLTIINGTARPGRIPDWGGGIFNTGMLTVSDCTLSGNTSLVLRAGGGAIYNQGTLTVSHSTLSSNVADFLGGGILNDGTLTVSHSTLSGNRVKDGGAIFGGTVTVSHSTLSDNFAANIGGAIDAGTVTVSDSTLSDNFASDSGGAIFGGTVTVSHSTVSGNSAGNSGGGIYNFGSLTVSDSTLSGNSAGNSGGGIYNFGTVTVSHSTLSGNSVGISGGVLRENGATGAAAGGALANVGANARAQLFGTLVVSNRATGSLAQGGGVANLDGASLRATLTTFLANVADGTTASQGGAVYNGAGSDVRLTLSLLSRNRAVGAHGQGGGLYLADGRTSGLVWTVILGNLAPGGGADVFVAP